MTNIIDMTGKPYNAEDPVTSAPDEMLVTRIEYILEMAKSGRLRTFCGFGQIPKEGAVVTLIHDLPPSHPERDVYQMMGGIHCLAMKYNEKLKQELGHLP